MSDFDLVANRLIRKGCRELFVNAWMQRGGCPIQKFMGQPHATRAQAVREGKGFGLASSYSYQVAYRIRIIPKRWVRP